MHQHTQRELECVRLPGTRVRAVLIQLIPVERVEPVLAQQLPFTHNTDGTIHGRSYHRRITSCLYLYREVSASCR